AAFLSLRALINPRANQRDLLGRQRLWRRATGTTTGATGSTTAARTLLTAGSAGIIPGTTAWVTARTDVSPAFSATLPPAATGPTALSSGTATGSARPATTASVPLGRHRRLVIKLGDGDEQRAFRALAGDYDLAVVTALEDGFEAVQAQVVLWPLLAVAS